MVNETMRPGGGGGESATQPITLREHFQSTMDMLERRIVELMGSNDRRYMELFQASKEATVAAMSAAKEAVLAALAASERAIEKAEESQLRVNATQNEFRQQLKDQQATFATLMAHDGLDRRVQVLEKNTITKEMHETLISRISSVEKMDSVGMGKSGITTILWGLFGSVLVAIIVAVVIRFLTMKP